MGAVDEGALCPFGVEHGPIAEGPTGASVLGGDAATLGGCHQAEGEAPAAEGLLHLAEARVDRAQEVVAQEDAAAILLRREHVLLEDIIPAAGILVDPAQLGELAARDRAETMDVGAAKAIPEAAVAGPGTDVQRADVGAVGGGHRGSKGGAKEGMPGVRG